MKKIVTNNFSSTIDWEKQAKKLSKEAPELKTDKVSIDTPLEKIRALLSVGAIKTASIKLKEFYLTNKSDYIKEFGDPTK